MTFIDEDRETHEDFDDRPVRCISCGVYYSPDDGDFIATAQGPICLSCSGRSEGKAA